MRFIGHIVVSSFSNICNCNYGKDYQITGCRPANYGGLFPGVRPSFRRNGQFQESAEPVPRCLKPPAGTEPGSLIVFVVVLQTTALERIAGVEPAGDSLSGCCSTQLSYIRR